MSASVYPAGLPGPSLSAVTPAERRLLSDVTGGPQQARGLQRDYLATQHIEWNALDAGEAAALQAWWRHTLTYGGAWFASTWPAPQGWVSIVRRFVGAPQWTHLPGGLWRASAQVQMRGRGLSPNVNPPTVYPLPFPAVALPGGAGVGDSTYSVSFGPAADAATTIDPSYMWRVMGFDGSLWSTALEAALNWADNYLTSFTYSPNTLTEQRALQGATMTLNVVSAAEIDATLVVSRYYGYPGDSGDVGYFPVSTAIQIDRI